jgi:hypothetical protein
MAEAKPLSSTEISRTKPDLCLAHRSPGIYLLEEEVDGGGQTSVQHRHLHVGDLLDELT